MIDTNLANTVYDYLKNSDKDLFANFSEDELETCEKIASYISDRSKPVELNNSQIQDIRLKIDNYNSKTIKIGESKIPKEKLEIVYKKFHPEPSTQEVGLLDTLPIDVLVEILSKGAGFDVNLVSPKWRDIFSPKFNEEERGSPSYQTAMTRKDQIWKGIGQRLGCPPLTAAHGELSEKVKNFCKEYRKEIKSLPEATGDVKKLCEESITLDKMLQLKEWREARDTIVVWLSLSEQIREPMPPPFVGIKTRQQMIDKAKEFPKWFEVHKTELDSLKYLGLASLKLASLPPEIGSLSSLVTINLDDNIFTTIPPEIYSLDKLRGLELHRNNLTSLPPEIGSFKDLFKLDLGRNKIATLPHEIGNLKNLREFNLYSNKIASLPPEIGSLTKLVKLVLGDNSIAKLPAEIKFLTSLETLTISDNKLSTLPSEIGDLIELKSLEIYGNQLTSLPSEIGGLISLENLYLGRNANLVLPPEISSLKALKNLYLSRNQDRLMSLEVQQALASLEQIGCIITKYNF